MCPEEEKGRPIQRQRQNWYSIVCRRSDENGIVYIHIERYSVASTPINIIYTLNNIGKIRYRKVITRISRVQAFPFSAYRPPLVLHRTGPQRFRLFRKKEKYSYFLFLYIRF